MGRKLFPSLISSTKSWTLVASRFLTKFTFVLPSKWCNGQGLSASHLWIPSRQEVNRLSPSITLTISIRCTLRFSSVKQNPPLGPRTEDIKSWRVYFCINLERYAFGIFVASLISFADIFFSSEELTAKNSTALSAYLEELESMILCFLQI